jgi:hypothetical protein
LGNLGHDQLGMDIKRRTQDEHWMLGPPWTGNTIHPSFPQQAPLPTLVFRKKRKAAINEQCKANLGFFRQHSKNAGTASI